MMLLSPLPPDLASQCGSLVGAGELLGTHEALQPQLGVTLDELL